MTDRTAVALARCEGYDPARVEEAVRHTVTLLGGMSEFVHDGQRVLLKPNLCRPMAPETAVTTHPAVVRAVAILVREAGATPVIAESPGGAFSRRILQRLYEKTGMTRVAQETGAELNYDVRALQVSHPGAKLLHVLDIIKVATEVDAIISLPKLKTHNLTRITGATKNLFGLVPGVTKIAYHNKLQDAERFSTGLIDILTYASPVLTLMDSIVAMHGNGPSGGDPFPMGTVIASSNAVAVDVMAAYLVGFEPRTIEPVRIAIEQGLCSGCVGDMTIRGGSLEEMRVQGFRPGTATVMDPGLLPRGLLRILAPLLMARRVKGTESETLSVSTLPPALRQWVTRQMVPTPVAGPKCTGCGFCAEHCPVDAITITDRHAHIDPGQCIRCYCCHELCPYLAVDLKRPWVGRLLFGE